MTKWPRLTTEFREGYAHCFGCGQDNPIGLKLRFQPEGEGVRGEFMPRLDYQGWAGYLHGGILCCLLDEAASHAVRSCGVHSVTARLDARLKHFTPVARPLVITARVTRQTRKVVRCSATVSLRDGTIVAESTSAHFVVTALPRQADDGADGKTHG